ncbi:MAG: SAM-dependent methyltransferase [Bacteroidales bacterium]|nr:SAM-dependent methyltransferase [Bacteroidales bacterium]
MNQPTLDYIRTHANDDVRRLALRRAPQDVDLREALQNIEGRQIATRKLPSWAAIDGLLFPSRLSMEQCSSEATAAYKRFVVGRHSTDDACFADLTAGFGVDFATIGRDFRRALYVDTSEELCALARHNMPLLGLLQAEVLQTTAEEALSRLHDVSVIMIDPSRRNAAGGRTVLIEDCSPDVAALSGALCRAARVVMVKLSPMLDLTAAVRALQCVTELHVVSVAGECKELLFLLSAPAGAAAEPVIHCVNLSKSFSAANAGPPDPFSFTQSEEAAADVPFAHSLGAYLYEPNASILKAGAFKTLCHRYPVLKLSPQAHLYTADAYLEDFPGRIWRVLSHTTFAKKALKGFFEGVGAADLIVRGFPLSTAELRRQLRLRESGEVQIIATTLAEGRRCLVRVERMNTLQKGNNP